MTETARPIVVALTLLTLVTGIVDAASVLGLGHVFTANMTGNVVFLGFAFAGRGDVSISSCLQALASFMVGALVGGRACRHLSAATLKLAFGIELGALVAAVALGFATRGRSSEALAATATVSLLALAMGLRNAVVRRLGVPDMTTTVLTLTITGLAADSSIAGGTNPRWRRRVLAIAVMLAGAAIGASLLTTGMEWVIAAATLAEGAAVLLLARNAHLLEPSS